MVLYYAYTQYHLFNSINLQLSKHKNEPSEIFFVRPDDANLKPLYSRLLELEIFDNIVDFDSVWLDDRNFLTKINSAIPVAKNIVQHSKKIKGLSFSEKVDIIYTYGSSVELYLLYDYIKKTNNRNVKLVCYEEGVGSYCRKADNQLGRFPKLIIEKYLKIEMPEFFETIMVYQPECMGIEQKCDVIPMPRVNRKNANLINDIFGYSEFGDYSRFVFFNGPDRMIDKYLSSIVQDLDCKDLTIKCHPRSKLQGDKRGFLYQNSQWEMICLNHSAANKVFISQISTAMFSAKSMFNEEPYLIFLFELEGTEKYFDYNSKINKAYNNYIKNFIRSYSDETKIYIPRTIVELKDLIARLNKEDNDNV